MGTPKAGGPVMSDLTANSDHVPEGQRALRVADDSQTAEVEARRARQLRSPWLAAAAVMVVVAIAAVGVMVRGRSSPAGPAAATPFSDALIPGDSSKFVVDATYPDGTQVPVNSTFVKVWTLANVGKVDWHNRFLARMNPAADADGCQMPDRVPIGDTPPGDKVNISVEVTAPNHPGKCWVSWKMVDEHGQEYFPTRRPVYFLVNVTA
ncbi:NBR1-Ig-like domain-containing protein [Micromonospora sp. DT201]|uniref:NBR1-Ig-like domain-containing protein n=1 Tax=Micromonospora sp. DT201 TaxID=3393442 RepID=UPI003CF60A90